MACRSGSRPRINGLRVHTAALVATIDPQGRLAWWQYANTGQRQQLTAAQALGVAAVRAGAQVESLPPAADTRGRGPHRFANPYARRLRKPEPVSAELVWFMSADGLRMSWLTDIESGPGAWYGTVVDAETGLVLEVESRYKHSGPNGNVFTGQHPDDSPARGLVDFTGVNGSWVTSTTTTGNNVDAYLDRNDDDANNEYQPDNADQHFQYGFTNAWRGLPDGTDLADLTDPTIQTALDADRDAIITQLFYYTNDMHDWLWGFGFDEASGNFQVTNFSGDGADGDAVQAEAQDGFAFGCDGATRCLNNANFGTDGDGTTARMQMYMWARPNRPYRDGSLDGDVIAHEYGHGSRTPPRPDQRRTQPGRIPG